MIAITKRGDLTQRAYGAHRMENLDGCEGHLEGIMPTTNAVREPQIENPVEVWEPVRVPQKRVIPRIPGPRLQRPLFADSLLDADEQERKSRKFSTMLSFIFQCLLMGTLLIGPLMFTEALPKQQLLTFLMAPPPPPPCRAGGGQSRPADPE